MKKRRGSFWGRRSYLTARFPLSVYPEPFPIWEPPGKPGAFEGSWRKLNGDTVIETTVSRISSGCDPRETPDGEDALFVEKTSWGYEWWEGHRRYLEVEPGKPIDEASKELGEAECPIGIIEAYRKEDRWISKWIHGVLERGDRTAFEAAWAALPETVRRVLATSRCARATYFERNGDQALVTWAVKWFYPDTKLGFARDLSRLVKAFKRAGVPIRIR
jgi:hypothetical protein